MGLRGRDSGVELSGGFDLGIYINVYNHVLGCRDLAQRVNLAIRLKLGETT